MQIPKQFSGKLNLDNVIEAIPDGDYMYMIDGMIGTSHDGKRGSVENVVGDAVVEVYGEEYRCIGGCRDTTKNKHFLFLCDTENSDHRIVEVSQNNDGSTSCRDLYIGSYLNFDIEFPVQATFVNGYIYYTDNYDPIKAAKVWKATESPEWGNLIKRGGIYAPTFTKATDATVSLNLISDKYFQFAYQYIYNNNETSVLSPYSKMSGANLPLETYNKIVVSLPNTESIPSNVKKIKFAVKRGDASTFQYIGTIERSGGVFASTSVDFYNSVYGGVVPVDYENTEHSVPVTAKSIEIIKNRLWLGNLVEGYNVPSAINMGIGTTSIQYANVGDPILTENVTFTYVDRYNYTVQNLGNGQISITNNGIDNNIAILYQGVLETDLRSVNGKQVSSVTLNGVTAYEITNASYDQNGTVPYATIGLGLVPFGVNPTVTLYGSPTPTTYVAYRLGNSFTGTLRTFVQPGEENAQNGEKTFSNNSTYKVGIVYKDSDGRSSSVVPSTYEIKTSSVNYSNRITAEWTLPSGYQPNVIPYWAESYHIVLSKNLTKSQFFECRAVRINYYKDATLYQSYSSNNTGIKIDIVPINNAGFSYIFESGDRVVIYKPDGTKTYNLPIKQFTGGEILLDNTSIGTISTQNCFIEIYKPKAVTEQVLYYEIGDGYSITSPGQEERSFSTTNGTIGGDCYNFLRYTYTWNGTSYVTSASETLFKQMSLDIKTSNWYVNAGKAYIISDKGQVSRPYTFRHSGTFIDGTQVNGLSEFYSADESNVPYENGEIMRLKSANRTASEGTVLLAVCRERVASIYVDESRLRINGQNDFLISGSQVIGEVNTLQGWYGTNHPSSVFDDGKNVYWFSQNKRAFVRYAANGIFPISELNVSDFFSDVSKKDITDELTFVCGGYFPYYDIVMVTVNHSNTYSLVPWESNEIEKTISYSDSNQAWIGFHSIVPDYYMDISDKMLTFRGGKLYRHDNTSSFGSFGGERYETKIRVPVNSNPLNPKVWRIAQVFAGHKFIKPDNDGGEELATIDNTQIFMSFNTEPTNGTAPYSETFMDEMYVNDSVIYVPIGYDQTSAGGWAYGADLISTTLMVDLKFISDAFRYVSLLNIGFIPGPGHDL